MYTKNILAVSGAFIAAVAAVPMAKRDIVWVTETKEDVVTMPVTTTVWVNPGESTQTGSVSHFGHHHRSKVTSTLQSTVTVPAIPESSAESSAESTSEASSSTSVYVAPTPSSTYVAPTTSSVYVAPTTSSTSVYVAPTISSTSVYVAPTTSSTSVYVAPTSAPEASTYAPSTTTAAAPSGTSSGATYTGDITYYDVGLGSCGWTNDDSEAIVALPTGMMQAGNAVNPNKNPYCGQYINISYGGQTHQAKVVDTCGGCEGGSIDLSPALFKTVAPSGDGRVHDVEWSFSS